MLGIRLSADVEESLDRYARDVGRSKSVIVRDWIVERLERDSIDERMRRASRSIADLFTAEDRAMLELESDAWLRLLDAEDGGYDWGPEGAPR